MAWLRNLCFAFESKSSFPFQLIQQFYNKLNHTKDFIKITLKKRTSDLIFLGTPDFLFRMV